MPTHNLYHPIWLLFVTGFVKRGLPHTSNSLNLMTITLLERKVDICNFFHPLSSVITHFGLNFKPIALHNLWLRIIEVGKLDVCGRPLFTNPVTFFQQTTLWNFVSCGIFSTENEQNTGWLERSSMQNGWHLSIWFQLHRT